MPMVPVCRTRQAAAALLVVAVPEALALSAGGPTPAKERALKLVKRMNFTEKATMLNGLWGLGWGPDDHPYVGNIHDIPRLGVPWLSLQDGPQGYRDGKYGHYAGAPGTATQWPSTITVGATWDPELAREWGVAMGSEFRAKGANCQLGPGLNVHRAPRGGRNFEYLSGEDPALGAALAGPVIHGIQSQGVIATAKHFMLNNQEDHRGNMSSNVDERTLMEIYHPPFEAAVKAGVGSIMCGYNKVNGDWACENSGTLGKILRDIDEFEGFVMSDWGGTHSTEKAALAGLDQEMPGGSWFTPALLASAVGNGTLPQNVVDDMATHVLTSMYAVGIMDGPQPTGTPDVNATSVAHQKLAQRIAEQAAVLLKNDANLLPLDCGQSIAVIGAAANCDAPTPTFGFGWPQNIGCMATGGGSGGVDSGRMVSIVDALEERCGSSVTYMNGTDPSAAAAAAAAANVAVIVVGTTSSEADDRDSVELPADQLAYLQAVAKAQPRSVVAVMTPGATVMDWAPAVPSIACFFLPGQEQGAVVSSVLYGDVNPSGRLPLTMPNKENEVGFTKEQYPGIEFADGLQTKYSERLEVGYRWYAAHGVTPAFSFGHGLSYTTFEYSPPVVRKVWDAWVLRLDVSNTGSVDGCEVVQVYLEFPDDSGEPPRQLKGFRKIFIASGSAPVALEFSLTPRDLSIWDVGEHGWAEQSGQFIAHIGGGLSDIRHSVAFDNSVIDLIVV